MNDKYITINTEEDEYYSSQDDEYLLREQMEYEERREAEKRGTEDLFESYIKQYEILCKVFCCMEESLKTAEDIKNKILYGIDRYPDFEERIISNQEEYSKAKGKLRDCELNSSLEIKNNNVVSCAEYLVEKLELISSFLGMRNRLKVAHHKRTEEFCRLKFKDKVPEKTDLKPFENKDDHDPNIPF